MVGPQGPPGIERPRRQPWNPVDATVVDLDGRGPVTKDDAGAARRAPKRCHQHADDGIAFLVNYGPGDSAGFPHAQRHFGWRGAVRELDDSEWIGVADIAECVGGDGVTSGWKLSKEEIAVRSGQHGPRRRRHPAKDQESGRAQRRDSPNGQPPGILEALRASGETSMVPGLWGGSTPSPTELDGVRYPSGRVQVLLIRQAVSVHAAATGRPRSNSPRRADGRNQV